MSAQEKPKKPPPDSVLGLAQRVQEIRPRGQCPSTFLSGRGRSVNIVFCEHREGHEGEHKGFRKKWPNEKKSAL